jgi:Trk K+ transport system NAD-binding subunit
MVVVDVDLDQANSVMKIDVSNSNHESIAATDTDTLQRIGLHTVDAVGLVHAMLLRIQPCHCP